MTQALLVMDVQNGSVDRVDRFDAKEPYLGRVVAAVGRAEQAGVLVVLVRVAFHPGYPEVSARNKSFSALRVGTGMVAGDPATEPVSRLLRGNGEVVVTKKRVSAFAGSDLELVLRSRDVDTLVPVNLVPFQRHCHTAPGRLQPVALAHHEGPTPPKFVRPALSG